MVVFGNVTTTAGAPIAGARVMIVSGPVPLRDIAALTNQRGEFSIAVPAPGTYLVQFATDDCGSAEATAVVGAGADAIVHVCLG